LVKDLGHTNLARILPLLVTFHELLRSALFEVVVVCQLVVDL